MFDNLKPNQNQAPAGTPPAPQPQVPSTPAGQTAATGEESIYTMPMEYYLGDKTVAATKGAVMSQAKTVPTAGPIPAPAATSGGKSLKFILIAVVIGLVLVGSGILLYLSTRESAPKTELAPVNQSGQNTENVTATTTPEPVTTPIEPVIETTTDTTTTNTAQQTSTEGVFDPTLIRSAVVDLLLSKDSDKDGLTDAEEKVLGTDPALDDTDRDGYKDGQETNNFYSPKESGAVKLDTLTTLSKYNDGFKFLYPATWTVSKMDDGSVKITGENGETIYILTQTKNVSDSLETWYLNQAPNISRSDLKYYNTFTKNPAVESPDGFTVFISNNDKVYVLNYNVGLKDQVDFPSIFGIIVNSFEY